MATSAVSDKAREEIYRRICSSEWAMGEKIPSSRELAQQYKCSVNTIEKAIKELVAEGILEREARRGTVVSCQTAPLPKERSGIIAVYIVGVDNPLWSSALRGIEDKLHSHDMSMIAASHDRNIKKLETIIHNSMNRKVDGIILTPIAGGNNDELTMLSELLHTVRSEGIEVVLLDRYLPGVSFPYVASDNMNGAYMLTKRLISNGHRKIAFVRNSLVSTVTDRLSGYKAALHDCDIPFDSNLDVYLPTSDEDFKDEFGSFCTKLANEIQQREVTAVFTANDQLALAAMQALNKLKMKMPRDISLVSYDVSNISVQTPVKITGVDQPFYEMGSIAADLIYKRIYGIDNETLPLGYICSSRFVEGESIMAVSDCPISARA